MTASPTNTSARGDYSALVEACTGARDARVALSLPPCWNYPGALASGAFPESLSGGPSTRACDCTGFARAERHDRRMGLQSAARDAGPDRQSGAIPRRVKRPSTQPCSALDLSAGETRQGRQARGDSATIRRLALHPATPVHRGLGPRPVINAGPLSGGQLRAVGTAPSRYLQAVAGLQSAAQQSTFNHREQARRSGWLQHSLPIPTAPRST